ncbi:hypothetical protein [Kineococcus sp. SYSU DK006]|uniref:hypothetical protein n=1 Tax=Kineococcus sp. SYSU DK006 TaxID=3383127 RepID=UPI003D7EE41D
MDAAGRALAAALGVRPTDRVRPPLDDPALGVDVPARPRRAWAHRLVVVGDSLTQGFQHYAVHATDLSWPALVADRLGARFAHPVDRGPGGYPLNLELLARRVLGRPAPAGLVAGYRYLRQVERCYERPLPPGPGARHENLGVWGWDLRDVLSRTADTERARVGPPGPSPLVDDAQARAAVQVLSGARDRAGRALGPLEAAQELGADPGGIETLCVWLGSNNALGSVVRLDAVPSGPGFRDLTAKARYTVWTVEHFRAELELLAARVERVDADHVLWATVPHVTIPPVTRGLGGPLPGLPRYFRFYGRPWKSDRTFDPDRDRHLTGGQVWAVDLAVDEYNRALVQVVERARQAGRDWRVVDQGAVLDRLAVRRNDELEARPVEFPPWPLPAELRDLDTRFFGTDEAGNRTRGGLFGLDGIHPTTCGYGIVAQEFTRAMHAAGVEFTAGPDLDFAALRRRDSLVRSPPPGLDAVLRRIDRWDQRLGVLRRWLPGRCGAAPAGAQAGA